MNDFEQKKEFADKFTPQIKTILQDNARHIVNIVIAPFEEDVLQATDYIVKVKGDTIAARLRSYTSFFDWTIRANRKSGIKTELEKLKSGFARWYLYGWITNNTIDDWVLIDLDLVRSKKILEQNWKEIFNHDGLSSFIAIPVGFLFEENCVTAFNLNNFEVTGKKYLSDYA